MRVLAMALCLSVRVCLSVTSRRSIKRNERTNLVFGVEAFSTSPTPRLKEIQVSTKVRVLPSGTFS